MAGCAVKILLALVFSLQLTVSESVLLGVLCATAVLLLYCYLYYLPFYTPAVNSYHCAFAMLYAWATFCAVVARVRDSAASGEQVEAFVFLLSSPAVMFSGYAFARQRFFSFGAQFSEHYGSQAVAAASMPVTACMVELRQRQFIAAVGWHKAGNDNASLDTDASPVAAGAGAAAASGGSGQGKASTGFSALSVVSPGFDRAAALQYLDRLYETAVAGPDCGALLRLFLAQYIRVYCCNRYIEQLELKSLQATSLPFDVAFFVFQRRRELKLEEKAGRIPGTMSIEAHIKFDACKARVDRQVLSAREHQAEFWMELMARKPSLARLDTIGSTIHKWIVEADESFQTLLRLNPTSVAAMRKYSEFLHEVCYRDDLSHWTTPVVLLHMMA